MTCTRRAFHQNHRFWSQSHQGDQGAPGEQSGSDHTVKHVPRAQRGGSRAGPKSGCVREAEPSDPAQVSRVWATCFCTRFPEIHVRPNTDPNQHRFPSTICIPCGSDDKESAYSAGDLGSNLEKGMATHSSILAWKIPWTEEPGGVHGVAKSRTRWKD